MRHSKDLVGPLPVFDPLEWTSCTVPHLCFPCKCANNKVPLLTLLDIVSNTMRLHGLRIRGSGSEIMVFRLMQGRAVVEVGEALKEPGVAFRYLIAPNKSGVRESG
jgi:hypothetical protein